MEALSFQGKIQALFKALCLLQTYLFRQKVLSKAIVLRARSQCPGGSEALAVSGGERAVGTALRREIATLSN